MDLEAPADAWYTYVAVSIVSVALAGLALGVTTGPPPDAQQAANAIEGATGSEYTASASYEHDAQRVTIDRQTITMENEHGTSHASFAYDIVVPVNDHERLENLVYGSTFEDEYASELADPDTHAVEAFTADVEDAFNETAGTSLSATGELHARKIVVDPDSDELAPLTEEATVTVTETDTAVASLGGDGIREVTLEYDGIDGRTVDFTIEGNHTLRGSFTETDTATFADGSGTISLEITTSMIEQPAAEPVEFTAEFDGSGDLSSVTWTENGLESDDKFVRDDEREREAEFDHDHSIIGRNNGDNYHVTLVIV